MRLPDDDEVYEVDQTYLGPPGRYIAPMRYRAIFAWLVIGPLTFVVLRQVGFPFTFLTVSLLVVAVTGLAQYIADQATGERPMASVAGSMWHEVTAPREASTRLRASGSTYRRALRPLGPLGHWLTRHRGGPPVDRRGLGRLRAWLATQRHRIL